MPSEELEQRDVAVEAADSKESTAPTGDKPVARQPEESEQKEINLDELPSFRKYKSQSDKREAELRRQYAETQRALDQLQGQLHQQRVQGMDDTQRLAYENQLLKQQIQETERKRQLDYMAFQRDRDITEVAAELGVDRDVLEESLEPGDDSFALWKKAHRLQQTGRETKAPPKAQASQSRVDSKVDLGVGSPVGATNKYRQLYEKAMHDGDFGAMIEAVAAAAEAGTPLET